MPPKKSKPIVSEQESTGPVGGQRQQLTDIITPALRVLFVGYNPGLRSAAVGHHFAGPSNRFWRVLYEAGLTPVRLSAEQDGTMLSLGLGLTNLVDRPTRGAAELTAADYRQGRERLLQKLKEYRPQNVCYVGIGVYKAFAGLPKCDYGWQQQAVVEGCNDFVAPSTSGLNRMPYPEQLAIYRQLAAGIDHPN
ncbi:MAG: mismatch-specific DNA-glycosylase [Bacillota bacterium]